MKSTRAEIVLFGNKKQMNLCYLLTVYSHLKYQSRTNSLLKDFWKEG
jgi:hypothetical protein